MAAKRICFAALVLLAGAVGGLAAQAAGDFTVGRTADGRGVRITGYSGKLTAIRIPAEIDGLPVREIASRGFAYNQYGSPSAVAITAVSFPPGLEKIGDWAFDGHRITRLVIPNSVREIGDWAFAASGSGTLLSVTLSDRLAKVGSSVFWGQDKLTTVVAPIGVRVIGANMFRGCVSLSQVALSEGLFRIEAYAFGDCSALASITLPSTVEYVGANAFSGCSALAAVRVPELRASLTFGKDAFWGCRKLAETSRTALRKRGYTERF